MRRTIAAALTFIPSVAFAAFLYQNTISGAPPNLSGGTALVRAECDSLTANFASGVETYPAITSDVSTLGSSLLISNAAVPGNVLGNMTARLPAATALIAANPGKTNYIFSAFCTANNTTNPSYYPNGAALYCSDFAAILDSYRAAGYGKIIATTMTDFSADDAAPTGGTSGAWRAQVNTCIRAFVAQGHADVIADFAGDWFGYFNANINRLCFLDGLHMTYQCQAKIQREWVRAINGLAASGAPGVAGGFTIVQQLQKTLFVQWEPPATGGLYTNFELQYKRSADSSWTTWTHDAGSRQWTAQIGGLTEATPYDMQVRLTGPGGNGDWATLTASTAATTPGTFDAPRTLQSLLWPSTGAALSSGNTIVSNSVNTTFPGVGCTSSGKTSGKWYLEFVITGSTGAGVGLATDGWSNTNLGAFAMSANGGNGPSAVNGFTAVNTVNRAAWLNGERGMVAIDMDDGLAWIGKNGTWTNNGGTGNPATGAFPWVSWTPDGRIVYACFDVSQPNTGVQYVGSGFTFTPPSGYSGLN